MAKICVIYLDINTGFFPDLHYGLASLAASVRKNGHSFLLYHLTAEISEDIVAKKVLENNPDVVGFSLTTNQRKYLKRYSSAIFKKSNILQIAGGAHPSIEPEDILNLESIQGVCIGEGEKALPRLLEKIDNKKTFLDVGSFGFVYLMMKSKKIRFCRLTKTFRFYPIQIIQFLT